MEGVSTPTPTIFLYQKLVSQCPKNCPCSFSRFRKHKRTTLGNKVFLPLVHEPNRGLGMKSGVVEVIRVLWVLLQNPARVPKVPGSIPVVFPVIRIHDHDRFFGDTSVFGLPIFQVLNFQTSVGIVSLKTYFCRHFSFFLPARAKFVNIGFRERETRHGFNFESFKVV